MQAHFQVGGGLDIFGKTGILNIVKVLPGNGRLPMITKRSNRWFAGPGGYFFLPLQTLTFSTFQTILKVTRVLPANRRFPGIT